jgi:hypothetical protein
VSLANVLQAPVIVFVFFGKFIQGYEKRKGTASK